MMLPAWPRKSAAGAGGGKGGGADDGGDGEDEDDTEDRKINPAKAASKIWKELKPYREER